MLQIYFANKLMLLRHRGTSRFNSSVCIFNLNGRKKCNILNNAVKNKCCNQTSTDSYLSGVNHLSDFYQVETVCAELQILQH